jgi:LmbE family N-acetylglucosaminyl deacetylase
MAAGVISNLVRALLAGLRGDLSPADVIPEAFPAVRSVRSVRSARRAAASVRYDPLGPVVLLSPHLDDAVLSCWGVLRQPESVQAINFFTGTPKRGDLSTWDRITGASDPATQMRRRVSEDREALATVKRRPHNLDLIDSQYRRVAPSIARLRSAVAKISPSASCFYAPAGIGSHPDHTLTRRVALDLIGDGIPVRLYADLPYAVRFGWPHWVTGAAPEPHRMVDAWWEAGLGSVEQRVLEPQVQVLDAEEAAAKLKALQMYRTQFPAISANAGNGLADLEVLRYEVYWQVIP